MTRRSDRHRRRALGLVLGLIAAIALAPLAPSAHAAGAIERRAKKMSDQAAKHFAGKRYREAAELFEQAYALDAKRLVRLRNAGRAYEEAGMAERALHCFRRYAERETDPKLLADARARIARLDKVRSGAGAGKSQPVEGKSEPKEPAKPAPSGDATPSQPAAAAKASETPASPVVRRAAPGRGLPLGVGAAAVGLLGAGVGVLVKVAEAQGVIDDAKAADQLGTKGQYSYGEAGSTKLEDDERVVRNNRILGWSLVGLGVGGAAAATWLWLRGGESRVSWAPLGPADGAGWTAAVRF